MSRIELLSEDHINALRSVDLEKVKGITEEEKSQLKNQLKNLIEKAEKEKPSEKKAAEEAKKAEEKAEADLKEKENADMKQRIEELGQRVEQLTYKTNANEQNMKDLIGDFKKFMAEISDEISSYGS